MSEQQPPTDDKRERKRRKREQERERRERELEEEKRKQEEATTSANAKRKRRVYYSAVSSDEEEIKYKSPKSSSDDFKETISVTDAEAGRSKAKPALKPTKKPTLQPIPEVSKTYKDAQTETSLSLLVPFSKEIRRKLGLPEEPEEETPKRRTFLPAPVKRSEESFDSKLKEDRSDDDFATTSEAAGSKRTTYTGASRKPPSRTVSTIAPHEMPQAVEGQRQKTEREKFDELSMGIDDDDDDEEAYMERMRAKRKQAIQTKLGPQPSARSVGAWSYAGTRSLEQGGAFVYMVIPPDGGYGWLILFISFLCQVVVDGIVLSIGIILPFISEEFGSSPSTTSLIGSTQIGVYFFTGPITSAFINKYGFRPVAMFGSVVAICTILISTFSTDLGSLLFFYSVLGGMSLSMVWSSSQLIVGYYFEKYRPIASGVSCSGAGIGTVLFCYMNSQLAPEVGWRNTSRVHTIFIAVILVLVIFFIEVEPTRIGRMVGQNLPESDESDVEENMQAYFYSRITLHDTARRSKSMHGNLIFQYENMPTEEATRCNRFVQFICPPFKRFMAERSRPKSVEPDSRRVVIRQDVLDRQDIYYTGPTTYEPINQSLANDIIVDKERDIEIEMLPVSHRVTQSVHYNLSARHDSISSRPSRYSSDDSIHKRTNPYLEFVSPKNWVHPKIKRAFNMLFDLRLLGVLEFQILVASAFFFPMGFNIPFLYSKARAEIDKFYTDLISPAIGFSNFTFRITSGFIAYKFRPYTMAICGSGMMIGGFFVFLSSLFGEDLVWFQFTYAVTYGVAPAFYSTLRAIIYVQVLGLDKLTNAFGLTAMAMGTGVFIGSFTAGILIEITDGYEATFAFSGACIMFAGSLKLFLPAIVAWKKRRARKRQGTRRVKSGRK